MNCKTCGMPLPADAELCENCGTPVEVAESIAEAPETAPVSEQIPDQVPEETPPIMLNTAAEPPRKKLGLKAILIGAGALLLVLAVVIALNFGSITRWFLLNFGSADEIFQTVQQQNIEVLANAFGKAYETAYGSSGAQTTHTQTNMHIKPGKIVMSGLDGMTDANGQPMDMSWLKDIRVQVDANYRPDGYRVNMGIGFVQQRVISLEILADSATGKQYVAIPELNETYLCIPSEEALTSMSMLLPGYLPEPEVMQDVLARYLTIPLKHICDVTRSEETVTVDDMEAKAAVLTARMHEKAALEMVVEILQTAREDQALKAVVEAAGEAQSASVPGASAAEHYAQFQKTVDTALTECRAQLETAGTDEYLSWILYLDARSGAMLGQRLVSPEGEELLKFMVLTQDEEVAAQLAVPEVEILFQASVEKGIVDGKATLRVDGEDGLKIDFEEFDVLKSEGTIGIGFGEAVMDADMSLGALRLEIELQGTQTGKIKILVGGIVFATVSYEGKEVDEETITFPEKVLDAEDQMASYAWMAGMKFDTLLANLKAAGVPESLIQSLVQAWIGSSDTGVLY